MIYNLVEYLRLQFPLESFYPNQKYLIETNEIIPDRVVILTEMSGTIQAKTGWTERRVQVYCRDIDAPSARGLATKIYYYINDRNGCDLPQVEVDGIIYPEVTVGQIIADQTPSMINVDSAGRAEFVYNVMIKFTEV